MPAWLSAAIHWLWIFGEPGFTANDYGPAFGGLITWFKVVGLFALIGWLLSWVIAAFRTRDQARANRLDIAALVALGGCLVAVVLNVLLTTGQSCR